MKTCLSACLLVTIIAAGCGGDGDSPPAPSDGAATGQPERVKATPGVGKRGRDYGTDPISTLISARFKAEQKIRFLQIVQPMQMYRVEHGHFPETHEEFMEKIIKANSIKLPELAPGEQYVYDVEKAAEMTHYDPKDPPLLVERPGE